MSVSGAVTFEGAALGERPSRNVCEEIVKAVEDVLARYGGGINGTRETKEEIRPFLGDKPWNPWPARKVEVSFAFHVNDESAPDPAPDPTP